MSTKTMTRTVSLHAASLFALTILVGSADAQWWGWGRGGYFSSTPFEGYARGLADFTRSTGEANLYNSEAAMNFEQARSANFDNRLKYVKTYFERRRMHDQYMDEQRVEGRYNREMFSKAQPVEPLSAAELDPRTGRIEWPDTLLTPALSESRERFEDLAVQRSQEGPLTFESRNAVRRETKTMTDELREQVASYTANDYAAAKRFVERLSTDLRSLPTATAVARPERHVGMVALAMDDTDKLVTRD